MGLMKQALIVHFCDGLPDALILWQRNPVLLFSSNNERVCQASRECLPPSVLQVNHFNRSLVGLPGHDRADTPDTVAARHHDLHSYLILEKV